MIRVDLKEYEVYVGGLVGMHRHLESKFKHRKSLIENKDFGWHTDIEAACAEMAFAKWRKLYWNFSVNTFKDPDVQHFQVRHAQPLHYRLLIRPGDADHEDFVLVVGTSPTFYIVGWMKAAEAKIEKYHDKGKPGQDPCWKAWQEDLHKFED